MAGDPERGPDESAESRADRIRRQLVDSGIPIVALSEKPSDERFGGLERFDDTVTNVRIVYTGADPDGPFASVDTARWAGTRIDSGPLRRLVEHQMRRDGERISAVEWSEDDTTMVVDGRPVAGRIVRAGHRWWAARCERGEIEISVAARDWSPAVIRMHTLADVGPMLSRLRTPPASPRLPEPVPESLSREPHRALVDVALRCSQERAEWRADGGPVPQLPRYWSALWQAATQRQMALTDQARPVAHEAVRCMVEHLTGLHADAAWFRADNRLREQAIAETLLYGTGLTGGVPSLPAQLAWKRGHAVGAPGSSAEAETLAAASRQWARAWAAWADAQAKA